MVKAGVTVAATGGSAPVTPRTWSRRMRPRRVISVLVALILSVFGGGLITGTAHAAVRCGVDYTKNDSGSGFAAARGGASDTKNAGGSGFPASSPLHNPGASLDGWTLTYSYTGGQTLTQG